MTDETKTKQYIVMIEVAHVLTGDELHELLCKGVHENNTDALADLGATVHNIQVVGVIEQTG